MPGTRATYNAFVSYSHAADGKLAPAIQSALHKLACPWYRMRALRVFRDGTNLSAAPELWPRIEQALRESGALILLASPEAARSKWCRKETEFWCSKPDAGPIYLVLTDGEIVWNSDRGDFDPEQSTAVPPTLCGAFASEPLWVDLRWARSEADVSLKNPRFADAMATLAAALHGVDKDTLIGEDLRQHRRTRRTTASVIAVLALLFVVSFGLFLYARQQLTRATENLANTLATNAVNANDGRDVALLTAIAATRIAPTWQTHAALIQLLQRNRQVVRFLYPKDQLVNAASLAVSPQGWVVASSYMGHGELWDGSGQPREVPQSSLRPMFGFAGDRLLVLESDGDSMLLRDGASTQVIPGESPLGEAIFDPPRLLADKTGSTLAIADGFEGSANVTACSRAQQVACRNTKRDVPLAAAALSEDGSLLATAFLRDCCNAQIEVLRTRDLVIQSTIMREREQPLSIAPDDSGFLVIFASGNLMRVPQAATAEPLPIEAQKPHFSSRMITASSGRYTVFSDALEGVGLPDVDSLIVVLDRSMPANGPLARVERRATAIAGSGMELAAASFTPDAAVLVAATKGGRLVAWNTKDRSKLAERHVPVVSGWIQFASNDRGLIPMGRRVEIVNPWTLAVIHSFEIAEEVTAAAIDADGRIYLAHDGKAFEYDVRRARETELVVSPDALPPWQDGDDVETELLAVSKDGKLLATVQNVVGEGLSPKILLRSLHGDQRPLLLSTDNRRVQALSIGTTFLAAATDDKVRLWDRATGTPAAQPFLVSGAIATVELLGDDSQLAIHYQDGSVETITLALPALQRAACEIVNRDLSPDEWRAKLPSIPYEEHCKAILGRTLHHRW